MKLLIDTHIFIWLQGKLNQISQPALQAMQDPENAIFLSYASVWEMQIKQQIGRLKVSDFPLPELIEKMLKPPFIALLPIELGV